MEWEWKRFRYTFGRREREDLFEKFERYNSDIATFVQAREILAPRSERHAKPNLANFESFRSDGSSLYELLKSGWKCGCETHSVSLRLQPAKAIRQTTIHPRTFQVSFSLPRSDDETTKEIWKETSIHMVVEETQTQHETASPALPVIFSTSEPSLVRGPRSQLDVDILKSTRPRFRTKTHKILRFFDGKDQQSNQPATKLGNPAVLQGLYCLTSLDELSMPDLSAQSLSNISLITGSPLSGSQPIQYIDCLCAAIRKPQTASNHIGVLANNNRRQRASINSVGAPEQNYRTLLSLESFLSSKRQLLQTSLPARRIKLSWEQRLRIAVSISSAVLQFYDSPWLNEVWSKKDIYFFFGALDRDQRDLIGEPHFSRSFLPCTDTSTSMSSQRKSMDAFQRSLIVNPTLFALGIVLIELVSQFLVPRSSCSRG